MIRTRRSPGGGEQPAAQAKAKEKRGGRGKGAEAAPPAPKEQVNSLAVHLMQVEFAAIREAVSKAEGKDGASKYVYELVAALQIKLKKTAKLTKNPAEIVDLCVAAIENKWNETPDDTMKQPLEAVKTAVKRFWEDFNKAEDDQVDHKGSPSGKGETSGKAEEDEEEEEDDDDDDTDDDEDDNGAIVVEVPAEVGADMESTAQVISGLLKDVTKSSFKRLCKEAKIDLRHCSSILPFAAATASGRYAW